jgi:hypothetical protein
MHGRRFSSAARCAQVLLDGHRVVRAAFHRGVVRDHDDLAPVDAGDARYDTGARGGAVVHLLRRERAELQEGAAGVAQAIDALPWEQLSALDMPRPSALPTPQRGLGLARAQVGHEGGVGLFVRGELRRPRPRMRREDRAHAAASPSACI